MKRQIITIAAMVFFLLLFSMPLRSIEPMDKGAVWISGLLFGLLLIISAVYFLRLYNKEGDEDIRGKSFKR